MISSVGPALHVQRTLRFSAPDPEARRGARGARGATNRGVTHGFLPGATIGRAQFVGVSDGAQNECKNTYIPRHTG
eukprot:14218166-Alexandrium_andersonii.AAC.1